MDSFNQGMGLLFLFAELAAREWTLKLGQSCVFLPEQMEDWETFFMPRNFDRYLHLPLGAQGQRCALLVQNSDVDQLILQARKCGTVADGCDDDGTKSLFQDVLVRPFALLSFLAGEPFFLQGINAQMVDTPTRCKAHEVAFRAQKMIPVSMTLNVDGLVEMPVMFLVPESLLTQAIVGLTDPEAQAEVDQRFLEHAEDIEHEVAAWLASLESQEADGDNLPDVGDDDDDDLNASLNAAVLSRPDLAQRMMAPLLKLHYADVLDEDEEGIFGFCVFESLVELSDRDLRIVLDGTEVREKGAAGLACALSLASANLQAKVLRNLSANRRADVQLHLRHTYERVDVRDWQLRIEERAFFLTLAERIHPPASIMRQFEHFIKELDVYKNDLMQRTLQEMAAVVQLLGLQGGLTTVVHEMPRKDLLWAVQGVGEALVSRLLQTVSASERERFLEDAHYLRSQAKEDEDIRYYVLSGRIKFIELARDVIFTLPGTRRLRRRDDYESGC